MPHEVSRRQPILMPPESPRLTACCGRETGSKWELPSHYFVVIPVVAQLSFCIASIVSDDQSRYITGESENLPEDAVLGSSNYSEGQDIGAALKEVEEKTLFILSCWTISELTSSPRCLGPVVLLQPTDVLDPTLQARKITRSLTSYEFSSSAVRELTAHAPCRLHTHRVLGAASAGHSMVCMANWKCHLRTVGKAWSDRSGGVLLHSGVHGRKVTVRQTPSRGLRHREDASG
ncbi:hypothetical protein BDP55DRAFT_637938 [Colletotrichum godetiae]|uniref:Uncharacterized protein n=1 Tax=Colletotrichum godetiae TaxID=1209918 RepID=A0AAJ0ER82_9PEZI|nr:uncharacterized protein BDP55DRAFT_637938 [Colletotrichum godetiae]KAK1658309.1 hypothetical protein BDP55DRAFT_637938 [Colletotrichum godetiae]